MADGTLARPSLIRSIAHRLAGEGAFLPVEGQLAPFSGATGWLNSPPLSVDGLAGRVVLVDFWTYTCVNWLRTLPYLRAWDARYREQGLTIVGVHTPEFGFERDIENVERETRALGVTYPVAIDSGYAVWRAFANHYWPAVYLAVGEGRIRYHHFGEGEYAMTEMAIQQLLREAGAPDIDPGLTVVEPKGLEVAADWSSVRSGETYLGYGQASGFASDAVAVYDSPHAYPAARADLTLNAWDLSGTWTVGRDAVTLEAATGRIVFQFQARDVNLVMGPARRGVGVPFRVLLDGEPPRDAAGTDVDGEGRGVVADQRTYQLVRQTGPIVGRRFEVEFLGPGVEAYCFTFG
jgi:thiol-disulfide isomerase/thioredoxin